MYACVCFYICMYVYIYIYIYIYTHTRIHMRVCMRACTNVCTYEGANKAHKQFKSAVAKRKQLNQTDEPFKRKT